MKEGYSWMHLLIEFDHAAFRQHGLQMLHHFLLQTLLTKINNALWILNFTVTFRGKGINFRRVNEVSGDVSCSLWWNLGIWSFSVDRFNQLTTGGGWDKPVLVDIMSAGKLLGLASAATPNSTKKSLLHLLSLTIPARKSRITFSPHAYLLLQNLSSSSWFVNFLSRNYKEQKNYFLREKAHHQS